MPRIRQINPNTRYYPERILKKLKFIERYPMTYVEAPSGFGKTTFLRHFLESQSSQDIPQVFYDFESDEPLYLWQQICRRIERIDPRCGQRLLRFTPPDEDNFQEICDILSQISTENECFLWFDNYKNWNNRYSGELLAALARHRQAHLHVIISTQPLPADKRKKLSGCNNILELDNEDLMFCSEDIRCYFLEAGIPLSDEQLRQLYGLTEGWIMALSLQMLCYLDRGCFEQGGMMALLEHAFWDHLTPAEQDFLLKLSVFPKFNLAQASQLSGLNSSEIEVMLHNQRYFIQFDRDSRYFYFHSQLRGLLEEHFACLPQDTRRAIYLQAGDICSRSKNRRDMIRFYYASGDWERILEQADSSYQIADVLTEDIKHIVLDLLEQMSPESKTRYPRAVISLAFALFIMGENQRLMAMQESLTETVNRCSLPAAEKDALHGELELLFSFLEYNRISDMSRRHRRALELIGGPAKLISPKSAWTFGSPSILCLYWRESGKLDEELQEMDTCMPVYYRLTYGHGFGAELIMRAEACLMRGELDQALPLCHHALFAASSKHQDSIYQCGLVLLARAAILQGDSAGLADAVQSMTELSSRHMEDLSRYTADLAVGFLNILQDRTELVAPWLAKGDISSRRLVMMVEPMAFMVYGRCLLKSREYHKLLGVSDYFMNHCRIFPNLLPQIYIHLYCAEALDALGNRQEAAARLQEAVDLAMPDRIYLPFAECIRGIEPLLPLVSLKAGEREKLRELALPFRHGDSGPEEQAFTPRETEILRLLKDDLTNKEIALRMNLSPNTIRNNISAMLKKRGFKTRVQLQNLR